MLWHSDETTLNARCLINSWGCKKKKKKNLLGKCGESQTIHMTWACHPVCTVPGVLTAIGFDICYLLKKHLLSIFTLRSRLIVGGRERSRGRIWFTRQTLLPVQIKQLFFGMAYVIILSSPQVSSSQKAFFIAMFTEKPHQCIAVKWVVTSAMPDGEALLPSAHEERSSLWSLPL